VGSTPSIGTIFWHMLSALAGIFLDAGFTHHQRPSVLHRQDPHQRSP
jgi:hypothetical protein